MPWKKMLAYVTGEIEQSLLHRIEYLLEENRILRNQIEKRILLTDSERKILAQKAITLGKLTCLAEALAKVDGRYGHHRQGRYHPQMAQATRGQEV